MHANELDIDETLVRALVDTQFPEWAELPLAVVEPWGTDNAIYRLGDDLAVRLPRLPGGDDVGEDEWAPRIAARLPFEVPVMVARGRPSARYPQAWSVMTWLHGETPVGGVLDPEELTLLVRSLQRLDLPDGPAPGARRGEPLSVRDAAMRDALARVDAPGALEVWERAVAAPEWTGKRVWLHADLDARNVLVREGRLTGVIDWGCAGVGDPAVDVMAAWKLLDRAGRDRFRELLAVDDATWLRAEGWAASQAVIALGYYTPETNASLHAEATRWLTEVLPR